MSRRITSFETGGRQIPYNRLYPPGESAVQPPAGWQGRRFSTPNGWIVDRFSSLADDPAFPAVPDRPLLGSLITVNGSVTHQTLTGWETTPRMWEQDKDNNVYNPEWLSFRNEIIQALVDGGINRVRLEASSGIESDEDVWAKFTSGVYTYTDLKNRRYRTINDNADPNVLNAAGFHWSFIDYQMDNVVMPMKAKLAAMGLSLYINLNVVDYNPPAGQPAGDLDFAANAAEYAEFVAAVIDHLQSAYGVKPDGLEIILEPDFNSSWSSSAGTNIGQAAAAVAARLGSNTPELILPTTSHANIAEAWFNAAMAVPGASAYASMMSWHNYDFPNTALRNSLRNAAAAAGVKTAMLEHGGADVNEFYEDLTQANVSSWQQWSAAYTNADPGAFTSGWNYLVVDTVAGTAFPAQQFRKISQIWRHAPLGAVRIDSPSSNQTAHKAAAFIRPDGGYTACVIASAAGDFTIDGLPAGIYGVEYTTDAELRAAAADIPVGAQGRVNFTMPAAGVAAIYAKQG